MRNKFAARDRAYRKALGLDETLGNLPAIIGTVPTGSNSSQGRRRKFQRVGKYKKRNRTASKAILNVAL